MAWSKIAIVVVCVGVGASIPGPVRAQDATVPPRSEGGASRAFRYGLDGLGLGAYLGASTGYLVARSDGWTRSDWRTLGFGAGIGALVGAGVGVGLGAMDAARTQRPVGRIVLSNMGGGASFGTVLGAVGGMLSWLSDNPPEHILLGAAIGSLAGAGVGLGFAIIEANQDDSVASQGPRLALTMGAASQASGAPCFLPSLAGRY